MPGEVKDDDALRKNRQYPAPLDSACSTNGFMDLERRTFALDGRWLDGVLEISRLCPDLKIRTAHLSPDSSKGRHADGLSGINLIWVPAGCGFFVENEPVITRPGDFIQLERSLTHQLETRCGYVRKVVTTMVKDQERRHQRYLKSGSITMAMRRSASFECFDRDLRSIVKSCNAEIF